MAHWQEDQQPAHRCRVRIHECSLSGWAWYRVMGRPGSASHIVWPPSFADSTVAKLTGNMPTTHMAGVALAAAPSGASSHMMSVDVANDYVILTSDHAVARATSLRYSSGYVFCGQVCPVCVLKRLPAPGLCCRSVADVGTLIGSQGTCSLKRSFAYPPVLHQHQ